MNRISIAPEYRQLFAVVVRACKRSRPSSEIIASGLTRADADAMAATFNATAKLGRARVHRIQWRLVARKAVQA